MFEMMHHLHFWLIFSFIIMVLFIFKVSYKPINSALIGRIKTTQSEISQSESVLSEAVELLNQRKHELKTSEKLATDNYVKIQSQVDNQYESLVTKLHNQMVYDKESFNTYLQSNEQSVRNNISKEIVNESIDNITKKLKNELNESLHNELIDKSINHLQVSLKNR